MTKQALEYLNSAKLCFPVTKNRHPTHNVLFSAFHIWTAKRCALHIRWKRKTAICLPFNACTVAHLQSKSHSLPYTRPLYSQHSYTTQRGDPRERGRNKPPVYVLATALNMLQHFPCVYLADDWWGKLINTLQELPIVCFWVNRVQREFRVNTALPLRRGRVDYQGAWLCTCVMG